MRVAVLGPLEVHTDDGASLTVPGAKERLLLAILTAGSPGVVSFDALAESLWNGDLPTTARKSLQVHITRLRASLEPDRPRGSSGRFIVRRGPGYALPLPREAIDALRIGDLAARGRALLTSGQPEDAARAFTVAVDLWRGAPYADWPDAPFAEAERRRLTEIRAGAEAGLLQARLELGRHEDVLPEVERLVAADPLREDWWRLLLLALYRAGRQADALAAARRMRALLAEELGVRPGSALRELEAAILTQDPALDLPPRRAPPAPAVAGAEAGACPYKGLAAYQVTDAALFHGRHRLVQALVARLVDAPVLLVSGPSGAGKSSVVRAGLVPALAGGSLPGSQAWPSMIVTPGTAPVDVLAPLTGDRPPTERPVVLVCDQFEELWAPAVDAAERSAFLDAVLALLDDGVVARCVVVVRGDGVGRLAEHPAFAERAGASLVLVPCLSEAEIREIVREPARAVGLRVEPELTEAVVADVLGQVGALPLLSTALVGTWERRRGDVLTLAGYLEAGGVRGALTRSAETAYAALDDAGRDLARRLFVRLADTDDAGALVRRPVPLAELERWEAGGASRRAVAGTFIDRRLLAVDRDVLEVAHEALLTSWPRLARWLEDDATGRAVRRHLAPAASDWETAGRPDDELYRGARLAAAQDWAGTDDADLTPVEHAFLDASRRAAEAELGAARERADHEATARRRTRRLAVGLAAVLALAVIATVLAVRSQQQASQTSVVADANRLAALSTTAGRLDLSLLLAVQAVRLADTPETQDGLLAALAEHGRAERAIPFDGFPFGMHLVDEGRVLFFDADALRVWQVGLDTPAPALVPLPAGSQQLDGWRIVSPSPTEAELLAVGQSGDGTTWVRTVSADGSLRLLAEGPSLGGVPLGAGFSPDGRSVHLIVAVPDEERADSAARWSVLVIDVADGSVRESGLGGVVPAPVEALGALVDGASAVLWDGTGEAGPTVIDLVGLRASVAPAVSRPVGSLDFRPLPTGAAQFWEDGAVTLFDRGGAVVQQLEVHQEPVRDVVVSPDGTWAVTAGDGPQVVLWDIDPQTGVWTRRDVLTGHDGDVRHLALDPAGGRLFTMSQDDTIITWDLSSNGGFGESYRGLDGRWISNRPQRIAPEGLLVAPTRPGASIGEADAGPGPGTESVAATFLDPTTGEVVDQVVVGDTLGRWGSGSSVAVSPDGSKVAVTWGLGTTVLDARTHDEIATIVLPPNGSTAPGGELLPATPVWCAGWTPDGGALLLGASRHEGNSNESTGGSLVAVDTRTWEVDEATVPTGSAQSIEASPDGRLLVVTSASAAEIVLVDAASLEVVGRAPLAEGDRGTDLSFSSDGRLVATGGTSGSVYVFDTRSWALTDGPLVLHDGVLLQVEWLPDGRSVATSGSDGTVSLFDVDRGLVRGRPLAASGEPGKGFAFLVPDPTDRLVVLGGERAGRRYPLEPSAWLEEACAVVVRDLTRDEWERYLPGRPYERSCS